MATDPLQLAFERFLSDRDETALSAAIQRYGDRAPADVVFPMAHRICEVSLGGSGYRVVRVYDPDDGSTKLYIYPTQVPDYARAGVPFALQGAALQHWVEDELATPTNGPVQWSRYDPLLQDAGAHSHCG